LLTDTNCSSSRPLRKSLHVSTLNVDIEIGKQGGYRLSKDGALMNRWLKVTVHQHQNGEEHRCELIDRADIKRVVDHGDFRTIVFSYAMLNTGTAIPTDSVNVVETIEELWKQMNKA
jgi:hypothetical protein